MSTTAADISSTTATAGTTSWAPTAASTSTLPDLSLSSGTEDLADVIPAASTSGLGGDGSGGNEDGGQRAITFILPVIGVLIGVFFLICVFIYRHSVVQRRQAVRRQAENDEWLGSTAVLAEELASGVRTPDGSRSAGPSGGADSSNGAQRQSRRNRRVRGLRRTESGATIRTLPEYSKEAGDEEVVLVRRQSKGSMHSRLSDTSRVASPSASSPYRRPSVADLIRGGVDTIRRTGSLLSMVSNPRSNVGGGGGAGAGPGSGTAKTSVQGTAPAHMPPVMETITTAAIDGGFDPEMRGSASENASMSGTRSGRTSGLDVTHESEDEAVDLTGHRQGLGRREREDSPRSSTSSSDTATPMNRYDSRASLGDTPDAEGEETRGQGVIRSTGRPAPPYHPTRTNTSLSAGILRGDAPCYLETMPSPRPDESLGHSSTNSPLAPQPSRQTIRGRTSDSIRNLLYRTHLLRHRSSSPSSSSGGLLPLHLRSNPSAASSGASLLLRPISFRTSVPPSPRSVSVRNANANNNNNPYRHSFASTFSSLHNTQMPGAARNSSISLVIGSPIPSTAVRAGFAMEDMPRAGLSEEQMRFLSSSEAVDLLGVRLDAPHLPLTPTRGRQVRTGPEPGHSRTRSKGVTLVISSAAAARNDVADGQAAGEERGDVPVTAPLLDRRSSASSRLGRPVSSGDRDVSADDDPAGLSEEQRQEAETVTMKQVLPVRSEVDAVEREEAIKVAGKGDVGHHLIKGSPGEVEAGAAGGGSTDPEEKEAGQAGTEDSLVGADKEAGSGGCAGRSQGVA